MAVHIVEKEVQMAAQIVVKDVQMVANDAMCEAHFHELEAMMQLRSASEVT